MASMSRAACSVENSLSESPYLAPHPSAIFFEYWTVASKSAWDTGSGSDPKDVSRSASEKHLTLSDRPTPRGSNPTMSKRPVISAGSPTERYAASSTPEAPGPPGLTTSEPIRFFWLVARARSSEMPNCLPSPGLAQFCGTPSLPQSKLVLAGCRPITCFARSPHGCQDTDPILTGAPPELAPPVPDVGDPQRVVGVTQPVRPRVTTVSRTSATRRPTADLPSGRVIE